MINKQYSLIAEILFIISLNLSTQEEKPVILVCTPESTTKNKLETALCNTIRDDISFTLKLMSMYRIVMEDRNARLGLDDLSAYAAENKLDNIIFGKINKEGENEIIISLSVYDRLQDRVTVSREEKIQDVFEIFDASDRLVTSLIEGFSGIHVGYGELRLINNGYDGDYEVAIDEEYVGKNRYNIEKVFYGKHQVSIYQLRMLGKHIVFKENVEIPEDGITDVEFTIPYMLVDEEEELKNLDEAINTNWNEKPEEVEATIERAGKLFENIAYNKDLAVIKDKYSRIKAKFMEKEMYAPVFIEKKVLVEQKKNVIEIEKTKENEINQWVNENGFIKIKEVFASYFEKANDEFDNPELSEHWEILFENPENWNLTEKPGWLAINTELGHIWGRDNNQKNIFITQVFPMNCMIETKLIFDPAINYHQAGIVFYKNSSNYVGIMHTFVNEKAIQMDNEVGDTSKYVTIAFNATNLIYLRIIRKDDFYYGYYSLDGNNYTLLNKVKNKYLKDTYNVGLRAGNGDEYIPAKKVYFDYFRITYLGDDEEIE